ncbi:MAG: PAS domain-containing protein [Candidatus Omnitrophota bacterium]|nr:MAG: PAS domain-containing protein [Candidatus Omnitrophota bacterium]
MKKRLKRKTKNKKKAKESNLLYKYRLLSDLMNHIPDVIYFKDKKGKLIMVNEAHAKGLNLKPKEVVGKTDFDIFPKKRAKEMAKDDKYVIETGKPIIDKIERATRPDRVDNYVSTTKIPRYNDKGEIIGLVGISRDITHRMQLRHLIEEKEKFEKKLEALRESDRLKSEFITTVSHELRTPLTIIKEALMLLFDEITGPINEKQKEIIKKAHGTLEHLRHIIENLLDISKIDKGKLKLNYSLIDINELLLGSLESFKELAQEKRISLKHKIFKKPISIFMDAERIYQVISNLLGNAIKFTEENGEVLLEARILQDRVRIEVLDTGIGITQKNLPKLFNKFMQSSDLTPAKRKGLGLGLSIAKDLVEKHGGEIWAESKIGVGSKFYFTLPLYVMKGLNEPTRKKINALLNKNASTYLINLSIVNLREFRKRFEPKKFFKNLEPLIDGAFKKLYPCDIEKPQVVIHNYQSETCDILFPETRKTNANKLLTLIKQNIQAYFKKHNIENIMIKSQDLPPQTKDIQPLTAQSFVNLYLKKIYVIPELRRFKRISYKTNVEIYPYKNKRESVRSLDLSKGGICVMSPLRLRTDMQINIEMKLPPRIKPLLLKGRVAWIKKMEKTGKYKVGMEFIKLKDNKKRVLSRFVNSHYS